MAEFSPVTIGSIPGAVATAIRSDDDLDLRGAGYRGGLSAEQWAIGRLDLHLLKRQLV